MKKKEISRLRNTINNNIKEYLMENNLDLAIYNEYLNDITIKYNELTRKDLREEADSFSLLLL